MHLLGLILLAVLFLTAPATAQTGFNPVPDWDATVHYGAGVLVKYQGNVFVSQTTNVNIPPNSNFGGSAAWLSTAGFSAWNTATAYLTGQFVMFQGKFYTAIRGNSNAQPDTHTDDWSAQQTTGILSKFLDVTTFSGANTGAKITAALASGGCATSCALWIPAGDHTISSPVSISSKNVTIVGAGASVTRLLSSGTTIFSVSNSTVVLRDIQLNAQTGSGTIMTIATSNESKFQNVWFINGATALALDAVTRLVVDACTFDGYTSRAITSQNASVDSGDNTYTNNIFSGGTGATNAFSWTSGGGVFIAHNKFFNASTDTLAFNLSSGITGDIVIVGNSLEGIAGTLTTSIKITNSGTRLAAITIASNQITTASPTTGIAITNTAGSLTDVTITGNVIFAAVTPIALAGAIDGYSITGNQITGPGGSAKCMSLDASVLAGVVSSNHCSQNPAGIISATNFAQFYHSDPQSFAIVNAMSARDGSQVFCSDCTLTGSMAVCAASGAPSGVYAFRVSGAWRCQ